jgi:hypothetical protein
VSLLCLPVVLALAVRAQAEDWLPVSPEELSMTGDPKAPGAPAIYLYRQVDRNDAMSQESTYVRVKILTEEGRKYADVELPYIKGSEVIRSIEARTIRPDGSIANWDGTTYEKPIVAARGVKYLAKTFTLPAVEPGSIVEYRYRHAYPQGWVFDSHWILSQDLFTRHAKFSLDPSQYYGLRWSWPRGLPDGTAAPTKERGLIRLETHDVPAFVTEEYMPPANELKYRVDFIYIGDGNDEKDATAYWKRFGRKAYQDVNDFTSRRKAMEEAVAQTVKPDEGQEEKLRKLYARTQQLRNLSFEPQESEQEREREKLDDIHNVEDVWKRGYGDATQITWLFLALVRAAGMQADPELVAPRDEYFFDPRMLNSTQLRSNFVVVKLDGRELALDPGTPFNPFGLLPWSATAIRGLRLDKSGGSWADTPMPLPANARIERKADLKLTPANSLEGRVTVTYTGLEAAWRRMEESREDETERRRFLEDALKYAVPTGIDVALTNQPDWTSSDAPLVAEYDVRVPGYATAAGRRRLLPVGLFGSEEKRMFLRASRVQPLYFSFPFEHTDEVTIEVPPGQHIDSVPKAGNVDLKVLKYETSANGEGSRLQLRRNLRVNLSLVDVRFYGQVRDFFQQVRTGDAQQVVVSFDGPGNRN